MPEESRNEARVRQMIAAWLRAESIGDPTPRPSDTGSGLDVPAASARRVIAATRGILAEEIGAVLPPNPRSPLRPVAEALLLDQHPSAPHWTAADRREALDWFTLLIDHLGENGVERLVKALNSSR